MVVEQIVHQPLHLGGGDLDAVDVHPLLPGKRPAQAVLQELGEGEHRAERGPQLVADHAEEARHPRVVGRQAVDERGLALALAAPVHQGRGDPGQAPAQCAR
ncbi:hypothetical protein D3C87_1975580 [compost metagenome]